MPSGTDGPAYPSHPASKVGILEAEEFVAPITRSMNQGGRGQRAGPLRSRPEVEPVGVSCGASGAAPRDGTVSQDSILPRRERRSISLDGTRNHPADVPTRDRRVRWTEEENILLMRTHYIAQELERTTTRTYREILTTTWNDINPSKLSYPNLLSNRVRWILQNEKFSSVELDTIQKSLSPYAAVQISTLETEENSPEETKILTNPHLESTMKIFEKQMQMYGNTTPQERPKIPRLKGSKRILESVRKTNEIIEMNIKGNSTLEEIIDWVYAGALTICEENKIKIRENSKDTTTTKNEPPPWKIRLEKKINTIRNKIGILHTYLNTPSPTRKLQRKVTRLTSELHIQSRNEQLKQDLMTACDNLKQKAKALGNRIRRYNERVRRYQNNQLYYKNAKQFYRSLEEKITPEEEYPKKEDMHAVWREIWSRREQHDDEAFWIREAEKDTDKYIMQQVTITEQDIKTTIKKSSNWSAPGPDGIQNYWWKNYTATHKTLARIFQEALVDPSIMPEHITLGITHMLPKGTKNSDPKNYRPITCLPTIYKILTGVLTLHLWKHVEKYNIMAREQNGCRRDTQGCKEVLVVDSLITKQVKKKQRNISVAWIDYRKAFDSILHSWLLKTLQLYGVSKAIIDLLKHLMVAWKTKLRVNTNEGTYITDEISIKRGIFQGDKLSTLWFCLAINFLSKLLNNTNYGYIIERRNNIKINHRLYIDDLKLYATNEEQLIRQLKIVASFSRSIRMEMGLDKCAVLHVKRGKITTGEAMLVQDELEIQRLDPEGTYKYLGIQQGLDIKTSEAKTTFKQKFMDRVKKIVQSKLNAKAMFISISTWAIPCLAYSFGILKWSTTELKAIDTQVRKLLTKYGIHHPHASVNRLYIPRKDGGRGLQNIETTHHRATRELRQYIHSKDTPFFQALITEDENITALNLASTDQQSQPPDIAQLTEEWHGRALHGRYPTALKRNNVDRERSLTYLRNGYLYAETEGRLAAIQDQVVPTRSYLKNIAGCNILNDKCRKCSQHVESIQHITSSCPVLAPRAYTERHNAMAKAYHQAIAIKYGLLKTSKKIHEYLPRDFMENDKVKLYWDHPFATDRSIAHNRPDIVIFEKDPKKVTILDITIPADDNADKAHTEKIVKYHDLAFELKEINHLTSTTILPLIITTNGLVEKHLAENTERLGLDEKLIEKAQKEVILWTTRIVRSFLTTS